MSSRKPRRLNAQKAAPTKEEQQRSEQLAAKKKFVKNLMKSNTLIAFTGNEGVSHWGFPSNGDFVLSLLQQVYSWDGKNETFQRIIESITASKKETQQEEDLDSLFEDEDSEDENQEEEIEESVNESTVTTEVADQSKVVEEDLNNEVERLQALLEAAKKKVTQVPKLSSVK